MAWTTPRTWVKGDFPTVGRMNADLRDNPLFLMTVIGARVYLGATQSIPNNADTTVTWDTEGFDSDSMHNQSSVTSRLTVNTVGKYMVGCTLYFATSGANTTQKRVRMYRNRSGVDTEIARSAERSPGVSWNEAFLAGTVDDNQVGDYFYVQAFQDSGSAQNLVINSTQRNQFWAYRVST